MTLISDRSPKFQHFLIAYAKNTELTYSNKAVKFNNQIKSFLTNIPSVWNRKPWDYLSSLKGIIFNLKRVISSFHECICYISCIVKLKNYGNTSVFTVRRQMKKNDKIRNSGSVSMVSMGFWEPINFAKKGQISPANLRMRIILAPDNWNFKNQ